MTLRYSNTDRAANVNRSGSKANGPNPNGRKPKTQTTNGLEARAFKRKTAENTINPTVNSDRVFLYMSTYVINRKTKRVTLIVDRSMLTEGYNITEVRPIISTVVEADGTVTMKAATAIVSLQKDKTGRALVWVDVEQAKVTRIEILTITVIEKS